MDALFAWLFKYRSAAFSRGTLAFDSPIPIGVIAALALALIAFGVWSYLRTAGDLSRRDRILLATLRGLGAAVVGICLARPVLVIAESVAQRNVVAVLVDDSRSMRVADIQGGRTRSAVVNALVGGADSALLKALSERYQPRVYRVGGGGRVRDATTLRYDAPRTRLVGAVSRVTEELSGAPLAGVVVLSDGADNSAALGGPGLQEQLLTLRSRGVPVYTVGLGASRFDRDIEVSRIDVPRSVLRHSTVLVEVVLVQRGFGGQRLPVVVEDSGRILGSTTAVMPRDGEAVRVRIRVPAQETGARLLRVHVPVQDGEFVRENNERRTLLVVRDRREKVLYFEGEPRFELKFIRRALDGDPNVQLVALLRSAKDKYLRLGVDDSLELATGFPTTREELFTYRAMVLGSIEASFFTADQLQMIADFVSDRGGGLLLLGGRRAFAEGGYAGTSLSDAFPIEMGTPADSVGAMEVAARLTSFGALHPALQLGSSDSANQARWSALPPVTSVNTILRAKPGATVLLTAAAEGDGTGSGARNRPLLVTQRYGRGRVMALGTQDTWLWQMQMATEDSTHETVWRQLARWLVTDVPDRVEVQVAEEAGLGEAVTVRSLVNTRAFVRSNGAVVRGLFALPGGAARDATFDWAADRDGEYAATFVADAPGVHEISVQAVVGSDTVSSSRGFVRVAEPTDEYFGAELRTSLLRQVAEETGGRYYGADRALEIPKDLVYSPSGTTVIKKNDLWDMPALFLLLLILFGAEWALRRRRGLV